MIRYYFLEFLFAGILLYALAFGFVKLVKMILNHFDADRRAARQLKREAEEALEELDYARERDRKSQEHNNT